MANINALSEMIMELSMMSAKLRSIVRFVQTFLLKYILNIEMMTEDNCPFLGQPKLRKVLKDIVINEGETLTLEVEVYAVPEPKIVWFKDGQEVRADARVKIQRDSQRLETYNLTLNLIKREEAGIYELKASNTLGTAVSKSVVTVHSKFSILIKCRISFQWS